MQEELRVEVGEEVLYCPASFRKIEKIATVTRVTPTERIKIDKSERTFNQYGRSMGDSGWRGNDYIYKLTPEKKKELIEKEVIHKCLARFDECKDNLTYEQAKKILRILEAEE